MEPALKILNGGRHEAGKTDDTVTSPGRRGPTPARTVDAVSWWTRSTGSSMGRPG